MSAKYFRSLKFVLCCNHIGYVHTSFRRLRKDRVGILRCDADTGIWCDKCKNKSYPVEFLGTVRTEEAK